MRIFWLACPVFVTLFVAVTAGQQAARIDDAALARAGRTGDDWLTYGISQAETRFSPLTQINTTNVKSLSLAWSYDVGSGGGGQEATPLVSAPHRRCAPVADPRQRQRTEPGRRGTPTRKLSYRPHRVCAGAGAGAGPGVSLEAVRRLNLQ